MKNYIIETKRKVYKITNEGEIFSKAKGENDTHYVKYEHTHNQIVIGGGYIDKRIFFYQVFHNCKIKKNERVVFKNSKNDYSKDNLVVVRRKKSDPAYFKKSGKPILHYSIKNVLLGTYKTQNECSKKLNIIQNMVSKFLIKGIRKMDGSYFIYEGDKLKKIPNKVALRDSRADKLNIYQLDLEGNILNQFDNIKRAIEFLGLKEDSTSHIVKCCKLKRKVAYGYGWRYANNYNKKKLRNWVCYYENDTLKYIFKTRKELCEKLDLSKFMVSNIINKKYIPQQYSITEVGYEVGHNLNKQLGEPTEYKRAFRDYINVSYYDKNNILVKTYLSYEEIYNELSLTKDNVKYHLKNKRLLKNGGYLLESTDTIADIVDNMYLLYEKDNLTQSAYTLAELSAKSAKSTYKLLQLMEEKKDDLMVKKLKYSEAMKLIQN